MYMDDANSGIPGYVSAKEAARLLGVSDSRMYEYLREGRLPVRKVGNAYLIPRDALQEFKPHPTGRTRRKPPDWRVYKGGSVLATGIHVKVRAGRQEKLLEKLQRLREEQQHLFSGTIARYILKDSHKPFSSISIWLIWKDTEMPAEPAREQELAAFQAALADVLDWDTAEYSTGEGIIYT